MVNNTENINDGIHLLDKMVTVLPTGSLVLIFALGTVAVVAVAMILRTIYGKDKATTAKKDAEYEKYHADAILQRNHSEEMLRYTANKALLDGKLEAFDKLVAEQNVTMQKLISRISRYENIIESVKLHFDSIKHMHLPCKAQNDVAIDSIKRLLASYENSHKD